MYSGRNSHIFIVRLPLHSYIESMHSSWNHDDNLCGLIKVLNVWLFLTDGKSSNGIHA